MVLNFHNENFVALNLVYGRGEALHFFILDTSAILWTAKKKLKRISKLIVIVRLLWHWGKDLFLSESCF